MSTKKFQQLVLHKKRPPHQRRGSVDCGPEEWPTDEHIAAPLAPPSADAATFDLLNELRDMTVYIPAPTFPEEVDALTVSSPERRSPQQSNDPAPPRAPEGAVASLGGDHAATAAAAGSPYRALRVRLPTSDELPTYPVQFANHLKEVAISTIRTMLYPRILLRRRLRQRAKTDVPSDQTPKLTAQLMATTPLFKNWPTELIHQLSKEATYSSHEQRDIIVYEGEVPRALYFIVTGTCKLLTRATRPQLPLSPSNKVPGGGGAAAASPGSGIGTVTTTSATATTTSTAGSGSSSNPSGAAALLKSPRQTTPPRNKRINSANCALTSLAVSPVSFGSANLLTNEPYGQTLRALSKVEVYTVSRAAFSKVLALVPPQVSSHTISTAFERRNEKMTTRFPISVARLKAYNLFSRISDDFAALIISKLEPHAVPANFILLRGGQICESMFFVESGTIGHFRVDENGPVVPPSASAPVAQSSNASPGTGRALPAAAGAGATAPATHELLMSAMAPTLVGDSALMYNSANETHVTTLSDCDCYALSRHTFANLCRQHPSEVDTMLDAARDQRKAELRSNHLRFRAVITNMPIMRDLVPPQFERDFLNRFTPKSYRPMSCVCSTSNFCDRVMVLTKGKLQLGSVRGACDAGKKENEHCLLKRWESIGWSCVVPHRWGQTAMALEKTVETLELSYMDLMLFLHERGLLDKVTRIVKVLMFPRAHRDTVVAETAKLVGEHFPMYPISQSLHVNFYEMGFCSVHMSALDEAEKRDRERYASELALNPPVYRQLSKGLWVPLPTATGKGPRM